MSVRNLDKIFAPRRIAVIGASNETSKVGQRVFRNLIGTGFSGVVYPVNATRESVQGIQAYPSVSDLPATPDLAIVCTPASTVLGLVRECGEAGIRGMIILSAGFTETGEEGRELQDRIREEAAAFEDFRIVGPNCLGIIVPGLNLNASFAAATPDAGHIAFLSQSGALCTSVLDWALQNNVGFSHFVSVGNMLDVGFADLIDYFGQQPETQSIILYIESITGAREFMSAARAFARTKPIVAYKAGRFAESAQAAASHTGAIAGDDAVFDAVAQRAGLERVFEMDDMFDCAQLLAHHRAPKAPRLGIVTNAGGPGVMATDALIGRRGTLAEITPETIEKLNGVLPAAWSHGNPVDVLGDASPKRFTDACRVVLEDKGVDAALVILTPQAMTDPNETADAVVDLARDSHKPILAAWMGGDSVRHGLSVLARGGVPTYSTPEKAVHAFMHLASYSRNLELLYETPREVPLAFSMDRNQQSEKYNEILRAGPEILSERSSKELLDAYGIPVTMPEFAASADDAAGVADGIGYPVVMKVQSPQITHKTDVGGVIVGLHDDQEVRDAFANIAANVERERPDADFEGVTVQPMVDGGGGVEMIIGSKKDPTFGAVIMVGLGGVAAEVFRDFTLGLPPLSETLARRMLESLRCWPLLQGHRGRPAVDIDRLIEVLIRFSYLVADQPRIQELDINPMLVTPGDVIALDGRVIIDPSVDEEALPFSHLAIRPYPEQYVKHAVDEKGNAVTLRPIKPEDEPMWHELLTSCSEESIRARFFSLIREFTHETATRYCYIDYDREMAIVAELDVDGERKLAGVGRLVGDPDRLSAEYAVLIGDAFQNLGLGRHLTAYCLEIAETWGLKRIYATTTMRNRRMISIFEAFDFELRRDAEEGLVHVEKAL